MSAKSLSVFELQTEKKVKEEKKKKRKPDKLDLGYIYTIPDSSCAGTKTVSDKTYVHTLNASFGAVSVPERRCSALILGSESSCIG